jgi:hypothetical protein
MHNDQVKERDYTMQVITFEANIDKGVIQIPEQFVETFSGHVQVILVLAPKKRHSRAQAEFKALSLDTKNSKEE